MNLKEIEDTLNSCINCWDRGPWDEMEWLISEVKKKLPIKSSHCRTTHTACECILDNMNKLEAKVKELEISAEVDRDLVGAVDSLSEENTKLKAAMKIAKERIHSDICGPKCVCECEDIAKILGEE